MRKLIGGDGHVKLKSTPSGAKITIDGQRIGVTPLDWDLPPGKHTIQMDMPGRKSGVRDHVVVSNKTDLIVMTLPQDSTDEGGGKRPQWIPLAIGGAGLVMVGTGIVFLAIDQDPGPHKPPTIRNSGPAGAALVISGGVVAAGATAAYFLCFRSPRATSTPVAAVTSDGAYIGWTGRF